MLAALHTPWILLGALVLEGLVGYPSALWRVVGHPVSWVGRFLRFGETMLNTRGEKSGRDFLTGTLWLIVGLVIIGSGLAALSTALHQVPYGWIVELLLIATLVAGRSLYTHVAAVRDALTGSEINDARQKVALIVGRNTENLDEPAIARAAVESLAENASDGVIAPLFWGLIAGLPGIAAYKFVNTADSMWGHKNQRYEWFGKSAARLDDLLNLIPARLTGLLFCLAAAGAGRGSGAFQVMWRDAPKHLSPNAGWPEAAMAGALDCRLGGPRAYQGQQTEGVWLGEGNDELNAGDVSRALNLFLIILLVAALLLVSIGMVWEISP